jgi:4'-phosphopantetheinyl transferase
VWRASLDEVHALPVLERLLALDELARADRFRFQRDRSRYVTGRGILRLLLARYTGLDPARLEFRYGAHGKPELAGAGPQFNLAHSGPVALYAISSQEVGIDVELAQADFAGERIPENFFSSAEVQALRSLPSAEQPMAFLRCWTRKEAFIKARGDGLSLDLAAFDVDFVISSRAALLRTRWSSSEPREWTMRDLSDPQRGYIAAVARRSQSFKLNLNEVTSALHLAAEP